MRFGLGFGLDVESAALLLATFIKYENLLNQITNVDLVDSLGV